MLPSINEKIIRANTNTFAASLQAFAGNLERVAGERESGRMIVIALGPIPRFLDGGRNWGNIEIFYTLANAKMASVSKDWNGDIKLVYLPWDEIFGDVDSLLEHVARDEVHLNPDGYE